MEYLKQSPRSTVLIFVPEENNISNWRTEFKKAGVDDKNVIIACYASVYKFENTHFDLLVFDEVPHLDTLRRKGFCSTITADNVLALGAVVSVEELDALQSLYGEFEVWTITLENAIDMGILPTPRINVLHLQLDDQDRKLRYNGRLVTEKERYDAYQREVESSINAYNLRPNNFTQQRMFRAGNARKRFLGHLKEAKLREVCDKLREHNRRFLCFCSSIEQAESLGGSNAFTSLTPTSADVLNKFNNHEIDSLFVVQKCIEGQTLVDIECGVIGQLGGTDRITVQSIGRIMRAEKPMVYVLVFDGTKDDKFLETLTSSIPNDYIKHYNF